MYKIKAFTPVAAAWNVDEIKKDESTFDYNGLHFKHTTFNQEELIAFLDDLLTHHSEKVTLSIRLDNFLQPTIKGFDWEDAILEVTSE